MQTSLTPDHSLSRAAGLTEEQKAVSFVSLFIFTCSIPMIILQIVQAEKQLKFEEAMMTGLSAERREAMWQSAQQKAVSHYHSKKITRLCYSHWWDYVT